ncbi:Bifunctional proline dehydrogenase/delta-1-pyrroline-5-carboxylate dehydrogenase [Hyella patelloides LEGE 07179]|uniref:L-glutamate gamma-semialdehyde dehydrogenase n=1 Tax=Hyella patelloides LEGE 07179 TaxID=945734 RepID=A0A563VWC0_9CYAN|nr:L-glutamate gamma-semialdehyde dehydrogenase [Hyella patelloides]VEP15695.1 Bifunctional proline dehydrogenase/delta-1-pyrroline-5-carboxylate dehydrogenase [Hyella patelloides LEGE 07179]
MVATRSDRSYETQTQEIARELIQSTRNKSNILGRMRDRVRWDDKVLDWAMSNPGLRVQMFRFIDTIPALQSKTEIARHLQQYMSAEAVELPSALKGILNFSEPDSFPAQTAAATITKAVETLAYKYIAGENIAEVIKTIDRLRKDGMTYTIDLLGEAVITETEAQDYLQRYLNLIEQLTQKAQTWKRKEGIDRAEGEDIPQVQVSVKLTAFYSQFDPLDPVGSKEKVCARIRILLRRAKELGAAIHFDMEQYQYKDLTLQILKELLTEDEFCTRTDLGITLQAYLRDSYRDLQGVIDWAKERGNPLTVRLVKGAYWDQETIKSEQNHWLQPVYNEKAATDLNFEKMTQLLLENHEYLYAAIGSHNVRSQALACAIAEELKIPSRRFEMQVLYGMGDKLAQALVKRGHRVRVYCPYGELLPGMAYLIRRLLENTANSSFIRQNQEEKPIAELIAPPEVDKSKDISRNAQIDNSLTGNAPIPFIEYIPAADTDYANKRKRTLAQKALEKIKVNLGKTYLPYINGEYVETDKYLDSVNPSRNTELIGKVGQISIEQAEQAMVAAKNAFTAWKNTSVKERAIIIDKAADLMEQQRHELNAWICLEVGKIIPQADAEVTEAIDFCRYYAREMMALDDGYNYDVAGENNRYFYQPKGIAVVISPWNFPFAIATGMTVAALVPGNCTLLKPAANSSIIAAKITEILIEAGIPKGVFQYVPGKGSQVGNYLVEHKDTHVIVFTGSREVGCNIYAQAAQLQPGQKHLKRVIAEMGGKNAIIVDESADLDQAVVGVVQSAFGYTGQKCSACSRVIVAAPIYDIFLKRLVEATKSLNVGATDDPSIQVGPVIDASAKEKILQYITIGKQESQLALEVSVPEGGYYVSPTIFSNVAADATIAQEEIFGPVLAVIKADNFDQALTIANSTDYALTGGLYSRTPSRIDRAYRDFEVGNLYINRTITGAIVDRQPFGGFKLSGVGSKAGGPDYLLQFLDPRVVTENIQRQGFAPIEGT